MFLILKVMQKSLACQLPFFFTGKLLWACWYEWVEKSGMKYCHSRISCGPNLSNGALRCEFQVFDHEIFLHEVLKAHWDVRMWLCQYPVTRDYSGQLHKEASWEADCLTEMIQTKSTKVQTKDYFNCVWIQETSWKKEREIMWARRRNLLPLCLRIVFWACEKTVKFLLMCVRQPGLKTWRSPALVCFICHPRVLSSEAISKQSVRSLINMDELW